MEFKKQLHKIGLNIKQRRINRKYNKEGLTDEVLRRQVELNIRRNELDIPDSKHKIYGEWVQ